MNYSMTELTEAKRQIDSILQKLNETVRTLEAKDSPERYKSQVTLAKRRIDALSLALYLIEEKLHKDL